MHSDAKFRLGLQTHQVDEAILARVIELKGLFVLLDLLA